MENEVEFPILARIIFNVDEPRKDILKKTIGVESTEEVPGSVAYLEEKDGRLSLVIEANRISTMRAALNSYLGLSDLILKIVD